ncbi:alpha/beta hydrolase [Stenotrophomonas sepilia]|uniref:alpha/beta hydrolase n=1 Tax=Stenotrophomonas sepilia TaxID=2860290 RepID=UPI003557B091
MDSPIKRWPAVATLLSAVVCASSAIASPAASTGGVFISLYPAGATQPLGVQELHDTLDTGETLIYDVSEPTLEMYRPAPGKQNGTAVIVVPGGGFVALGYVRGGTDVARALAERGITAFVLKHRTVRSGDGPMRIPAVHMEEMEQVMSRARTGSPVEMPPFAGEPKAVEDGARAMTILRQRAGEWGVIPDRVGMIGFSSGAYLAADLAIGPKATRPDFVGLIYGGPRTPVPADASPAFIAGAADDDYQPNDPILLYSAWRGSGVPAELHMYERGGHGFDLHPKGVTSDLWFGQFIAWMQVRELMPTSGR